MNVKLLIDAIVRQTTVLIAQLSTTAGIRAPLAHVADQIFVELVREIEAQGVGRKVVADMFGLALRTYQKKVQRLTESVTNSNMTLWQAVMDYIQTHGSVTRSALLGRFKHDGEQNVAAVLNDLVTSGLVYKTGRGSSTVYGVTSEEDYRRLLDEDQIESVSSLAWVTIYRGDKVDREALLNTLRTEEAVLDKAIALLIGEGRIETFEDDEGGTFYKAATVVVPVGSSYGWEAAVFDHYQALTTAISAKLAMAQGRSERDDRIGGATLSFDIHPDHPHKDEVYALLQDVRKNINVVWDKVAAHNREQPVPEDQKVKVTFYFGQTVENTGAHEDEADSFSREDA